MKDWVGIAFPKSSKTVLKSKPKDISKTNREEIKKLFKGKNLFCILIREFTNILRISKIVKLFHFMPGGKIGIRCYAFFIRWAELRFSFRVPAAAY